jgi:hypothetical protein
MGIYAPDGQNLVGSTWRPGDHQRSAQLDDLHLNPRLAIDAGGNVYASNGGSTTGALRIHARSRHGEAFPF